MLAVVGSASFFKSYSLILLLPIILLPLSIPQPAPWIEDETKKELFQALIKLTVIEQITGIGKTYVFGYSMNFWLPIQVGQSQIQLIADTQNMLQILGNAYVGVRERDCGSQVIIFNQQGLLTLDSNKHQFLNQKRM